MADSTTKNLSGDPYDNPDADINAEAKDFGEEIRSHEVGEKIWELYKSLKDARKEEMPSPEYPRLLLMDLLSTLNMSDFRRLKIREEDIGNLQTFPEFIYSVGPKIVTPQRQTTEEVSNLDPESSSIPREYINSIVFLRNVFAVVAGLAKQSVTAEQNKAIIEDRKGRVRQILGHDIPTWTA